MTTASKRRAAANGGKMRSNDSAGPWVVYRMTPHGHRTPMHVVCEQSAWEALEADESPTQTRSAMTPLKSVMPMDLIR